MKGSTCDVLVVGAGPAGSSAALAAAQEGVKVHLVERRPRVGVPVQCAEYIPAPLLGTVQVGRDVIAQRVRGMLTHLPGGEVKETVGPGYVIHRDRFDQLLAAQAVDAGACLMLSTRAVGYEDGVVLLKDGSESTIRARAKVVIGADGPRSRVARWIGSVNRGLLPAAQLRMKLARPLDFTEVYFDPAFFGGYGWLFPKNHEANIGLGLKRRMGSEESLKGILEGFSERLRSEGKVVGEPYAYTGGLIPAEAPRVVRRGNIILAGDAAGHTHPITGAGVFSAVVCGRMAGKWAARAAKEDRMDLLDGYEEEWRDLLEETLLRAHRRRELMETEWHRLPEIVKTCWVAFREYYSAI